MNALPSGSVLSFDFGLKNIGVAIGETFTGSTRTLAVLSAKQGKPQWFKIDELCQTHQPVRCVVGLPLNMDGTESPMCEAARAFAERLHKRTKLPVDLHDERLTSYAATDSDQNIHAESARIILESYLAEFASEP